MANANETTTHAAKNLGMGGKIHAARIAKNGVEYMVCTGRAFHGLSVRFPTSMIACASCQKKLTAEAAASLHAEHATMQ